MSVAALLGLALHGMLTAGTLSVGDRSVFGVEAFDARPGYVLVAFLAVGCVLWAQLRPWWLVAMSVTTIGRAASLWILGSPDLARSAEQRGALGWVLLWLLGLLAVMVLEAAGILREVTAEA